MQLPHDNNAHRNLSALVDFSNNINSNLNLDFALNNLLLTCFGKLAVTKGIIALFNDDDEIEIALSKGVSEEILKNFPNKKKRGNTQAIIEEFCSNNNFVRCEEIVSSNKLLGYFILGKKITKEEYSIEDRLFLSTILKIGSTTIMNAQSFSKLSNLNKELDSKINQLNSIFDLGKEFSSILEIERVSKLLVYSISAQMLISKYAIVIFDGQSSEILDTKYDKHLLKSILSKEGITEITEPIKVDEKSEFCKACFDMEIALVVPMMIKKKRKGLLFLGPRITKQHYSKSDIEYISSVVSFAIISIENSRLFVETIEKQKMEKDLELARSIQQNLLPSKLPKSDYYQIAAINKTAKLVGGDYYDFVKLDDTRLLIAIADVSGKGIQASLLMANLQAFLKSIYKQNYKLEEASNFLNDLVCENTTNGSFITFFWGILNFETHEFKYVNMGHNPPLLIRDGNITKLRKGGMILGILKTVLPYDYEIIKMKPNDTLILFTDGVTEAMNNEKEEYTDERLEKLCLEISNNDTDVILDNILDDVYKHTAGAEQSDDITGLVLKIN